MCWEVSLLIRICLQQHYFLIPLLLPSLYNVPGTVFEDMRKIVCIELRSVTKQLESWRLLAVKHSHSEHHGAVLTRFRTLQF